MKRRNPARAKAVRAAVTKKRYRDHAADLNKAVADSLATFEPDPNETYDEALSRAKAFCEAYETADDRIANALNAMQRGLARKAGLAKKPDSKAKILCEKIAYRFHRDIEQFKRGVPISDKRLADMLRVVAGQANTTKQLNSLRRQLVRQFRDGRRGVEIRRNPPLGRPVARRLKTQYGEIARPPEFDIKKIFPGLCRITYAR